MFSIRLLAVMLTLLAATSPLLVGLLAIEAHREDGQEDRKLLEEWRQDAEHMARLRQNLATFRALPEERKNQIRQLDRDLHDQDSVSHARLVRVMERYGNWMENLPEKDRQLVQAATDARERLQRIQEIRERQWVEQLPRARRELLTSKTGKDRSALIEQWKHEERRGRDEWRVALRHWDDLIAKRPLPSRLADFPPDIQTFVTDQVRPMLSPEEAQRLQQAEGQWPLFPVTLVELADRHRIRLPGPSTGPSTMQKVHGVLPDEIRTAIESDPQLRKELRNIKALEGNWPDYAIEWLKLVNQARKRKPGLPLVQLPRTVAPSAPMDFSLPVRRFINKELPLVLNGDEKSRLKKAEGQWPLYPQTLLELATDHQLRIPGMSLPGPPERWDKYRSLPPIDQAVLPEPPEAALRAFLRGEQNREEQGIYHFSLADPFRHEWMKQEYFKKNPKELEKLRKADELKYKRRPRPREKVK